MEQAKMLRNSSILSNNNSALHLSDKASQTSECYASTAVANNGSQPILSLTRQKKWTSNIEDESCRMAQSVIADGRYFYLNLIGQKDDGVVRPMTTFKKVRRRKVNQDIKLEGMPSEELTREEKVVINYINSSLLSSQTSLKAKSIVLDKFFRKPKLELLVRKDQNQPKSRSSTGRSLGKSTKNISLKMNAKHNPQQSQGRVKLSSRQILQRNISNLLQISKKNQKSFLSKPNKRYAQHQSLSRENRRQIHQFYELNKSMANQNLPQTQPKRQLSPIQKYDISFNEYMIKKSDKRIQQEHLRRIQNKNKNIIDQYQDYALRTALLSQRNKEEAMKRFELINKQRRRIKQ